MSYHDRTKLLLLKKLILLRMLKERRERDRHTESEDSTSNEGSSEDVDDAASSNANRHSSKVEALRKGYEEQITSMKANMEAAQHKLHEKDQEVSRLRSRCGVLTWLLEQNRGFGGTADSLDREGNNPSAEFVSQMQLDNPCSLADDPDEASMMEPTVWPPQQAQSALDLQNQLTCKEQEVSRLRRMILAMSDLFSTHPPTRLPIDKVSVLSCEAGDVVLLSFHPGRQSYMVFYLGYVLHFPHSECLETLGLQTAPGAVRKNWVLAEVLEKTYCKACEQSQEQYRIRAGTWFYSVRCKLWDKEAAKRRDCQPQPSLRDLIDGTSPPSEDSWTAGSSSASSKPLTP